MARLLFWMAVTVALAYAVMEFSAWKLLWQLGLVCLFLLWTILGAWVLGRQLRDSRRASGVAAPTNEVDWRAVMHAARAERNFKAVEAERREQKARDVAAANAFDAREK